MKYDLIILGGGISGMTAAIYAARANLKACILEREICGGLVNSTNLVENLPSYESIHGMELMARCKAHVLSLGVKVEEVEEVTAVDLSGPVKVATTDMGDYEAPALIAATGRRPRPLPVDTEFENVHYCSICDGSAYKGKNVIVLGGGNSAFDESLYLLGLGVDRIHIVEAMDSCAAAAATQQELVDTGRARVSVATELAAVTPGGDGHAIFRLKDRKSGEIVEEKANAVFCFIGQVPNTALFQGQLELVHGYIPTNGDMETAIPGVYAAGDVRVKKYRQITTAMSDGTIAALSAAEFLRA